MNRVRGIWERKEARITLRFLTLADLKGGGYQIRFISDIEKAEQKRAWSMYLSFQ